MSTSRTIMVVDDELLIRDLLYDFFSNQGWRILVAENGEAALDQLADIDVDVVLADIKMPELDGLELTERLGEEKPQLPVVLMTGYPSVDTAVSALRLRAADYIVKPFNINQLYKLIDRTVEQAQAEVRDSA